ncbi:hypothetical protein ABIF63_006009 [Bradyrhizobium japonicum]|uniref:Uncharacterized protein n=1 Tax=Bradyrhizobium japonicum TaxID=375 RepID=A0ABV2RYA6_BRAJP
MSNFIMFATVVAISGALGWWIYQAQLLTRDGEWHPYAPSTYRMRRWRGKWEYRDMTPEEAQQHQLDNAV